MRLRERLKQLDYNRDGKINIDDAEFFVEERLTEAQLKLMVLGCAVGVVVTAIVFWVVT